MHPHLMTQWAYTPHFFTHWVPPSPATVHRQSSLSSSLTCTVGPYLLISRHSGPIPLIYIHSELQPHHLMNTLSGLSSSLTCTVGLYPLIYLHSEYQPRHLLYTDCPASFPPLFAQWAHTSLFMTRWAYTPSFSYTLGTTLASYCSQTVHPQFLPYLHSGPIPPHFRTQWVYTPSFTYTMDTILAIYWTQTAQSQFHHYLHSGPIPSHFITY